MRSSRALPGANLLHGTARPGAEGLTEVVLDAGGSAFTTDAGEGRVGLAVYPWEISLARSVPADSAVNHVQGNVRSLVAARKPRPRAGRPSHRRGHGGVG